MIRTTHLRYSTSHTRWVHASGMTSGQHRRLLAYYTLSTMLEIVKYEVIAERFIV
jgi:hypothetical protein